MAPHPVSLDLDVTPSEGRAVQEEAGIRPGRAGGGGPTGRTRRGRRSCIGAGPLT